jgi:hypothetical protein
LASLREILILLKIISNIEQGTPNDEVRKDMAGGYWLLAKIFLCVFAPLPECLNGRNRQAGLHEIFTYQPFNK